MNVLHVYKTYYPDTLGGIEQVIAQLCGALAAQGVRNRIYTLSPGAEPAVLLRPEAEVHRARTSVELASTPLSLQALREFGRHAAWADVIHYQFPWPFADVLHLLWGRHRPSVVSYQSDIVRQRWLLAPYRPLMRHFLRRVDQVVTTSPNYAAGSPDLRALRSAPCVIPNGIDEATYPVPDAARLARWQARLGQGFFLFVGVLRYYKGLQTLLQAAHGLPARVVIAGAGPEGERLQRAAREQALNNVVFLGPVDDADKMALLRLARALVFPSHLRSEAFGMSLVEAAMTGLPMISCEIGTGTSFINQNGQTGITVPPADAPALHAAMQQLHADPTMAAAMGHAARQRFEALFTAERMASAYLALYQSLLQSKAGRDR